MSVLELLLMMPWEIIEFKGYETQILWKDVINMSLEIGLLDSNLALIAIETLDKWFWSSEIMNENSSKSQQLVDILPKLSKYLVI